MAALAGSRASDVVENIDQFSVSTNALRTELNFSWCSPKHEVPAKELDLGIGQVPFEVRGGRTRRRLCQQHQGRDFGVDELGLGQIV